jgi:hypothetical protein
MDASRVSVGASHVVPKNKKFKAVSIDRAGRRSEISGSARAALPALAAQPP